jgi:hypothetical protein
MLEPFNMDGKHKERREMDTAFHFDKTITLSGIISLVGLIITLVVCYNGIAHRMDSMEVKVDLMWKYFVLTASNNSDGKK